MHYLPEQVFIEYNGTWGMDKLLEAELPKGLGDRAVTCNCGFHHI